MTYVAFISCILAAPAIFSSSDEFKLPELFRCRNVRWSLWIDISDSWTKSLCTNRSESGDLHCKIRTLEHFYNVSKCSLICHMFYSYKTRLRLLEHLLRTSFSNRQSTYSRDIIKVFELRKSIINEFSV